MSPRLEGWRLGTLGEVRVALLRVRHPCDGRLVELGGLQRHPGQAHPAVGSDSPGGQAPDDVVLRRIALELFLRSSDRAEQVRDELADRRRAVALH
ncbi:hypothetical protein, partial [Streptomyces sp. NPDC002785]|uniref:hypothetical protein n=1 Tax=Streptomyces sp. NPDC002785 TaxID=3154543 RepID=UPI00331DFFB1